MAKRTSQGSTPWDRENPKKKRGTPSRKLSPEKKAKARARARKAGRPYPNLVDNMAVARKRSTGGRRKSRKSGATTSGAKRGPAKKTAARKGQKATRTKR